nr:MAG TPA: hypothetical protein [Caudoviricetes sp.]
MKKPPPSSLAISQHPQKRQRCIHTTTEAISLWVCMHLLFC